MMKKYLMRLKTTHCKSIKRNVINNRFSVGHKKWGKIILMNLLQILKYKLDYVSLEIRKKD